MVDGVVDGLVGGVFFVFVGLIVCDLCGKLVVGWVVDWDLIVVVFSSLVGLGLLFIMDIE